MISRRRSVGAHARIHVLAALCAVVIACGGRSIVAGDVRGGDASQDGIGATRCAPGEVRCDGECTAVQSDREHCGTCGDACTGEDICRHGVCVDHCYPLHRCGDRCVDTVNDPNNCGECGTACESGATCENATCRRDCACATGLGCCPGSAACIDLHNDRSNCGACGVRCPALCTDGRCEACPAGLTFCGASCVDLRTDAANCGDCGIPCAPGFSCVGSLCIPSEGCGSETLCGTICVDRSTDPMNCGGCFNVCPVPLVCSAGMCTMPAAVSPPGSPCVDDASCASNSVGRGACRAPEMGYSGGSCTVPCAGDADCLGGICVRESATGSGWCSGRCGAGEFACRTGYVCAHSAFASDGFCAPDCNVEPAFCGANRCETTGSCAGCMQNRDCLGRGTCDTTTWTCRCASDTTCAPGYACNVSTGDCACTTDAACGAGHRCDPVSGRCVLPS